MQTTAGRMRREDVPEGESSVQAYLKMPAYRSGGTP
jgi:hypothetical protein